MNQTTLLDTNPTQYSAQRPKDQPRTAPGRKHEERVIIRSWPKILCAYPVAGLGLLFAILTWIWPQSQTLHAFCGQVFFGTGFLIALVMTFDCRGWHIVTVGFAVACAILSLWVLSFYFPVVDILLRLWAMVDLDATPQVYLFCTTLFGLLVGCCFIANHIDYWEVTPNELLHNYNPLSDLRRYPAANIKVEKEIPDVFEYLLLRSGRLIIYPNSERHAIVLDNVLHVNKVEERIKHLLGALEVRLDEDRV